MNEQVPASTETAVNKPFFVYMPGLLMQGSRNIATLRQLDELYVPVSLSARQAMKKGEKDIREHHVNTGREILKRAGGRDIKIFAHSMGGFEAIDIVSAMVESGGIKDRSIEIIFVATPGLNERGYKGLFDFAKRFADMNINVTTLEQHTAYPLPERYYQKHAKYSKAHQGAEVVFKDTPPLRTERKETFLRYLDRIVPDPAKRAKTIKDLSNIDNLLASRQLTAEEEQKLLKKRTQILHPLIQSIFRGEHFDSQTHEALLKQYGELPQDLASVPTSVLSAVRYFGRITKDIFRGLDKKTAQLVKRSKDAGVNFKLGLAVLERDAIIKPSDVPKIQTRLNESNITHAFESVYLIEQLTHSSPGYYPKPIEGFMKILSDRANQPATT